MRKAFFLLGLGLAVAASAAGADKKDPVKELQAEAWSADVSLDSAVIRPSRAVMFAVIDVDPSVYFRKQLIRLKPTWMKMSREFADKDNAFGFVQAKLTWDSAFERVRGDQVSLVIDEETLKQPGFSGAHSISSNDTKGRKYLVTRAVSDLKTDVYAWAIPLSLTKGQAQKIVLSDQNVIRLKPIFDEVMKAK